MDLQEIHYDGEYLSGRFLVGAEGERLRLDKRLFSNIDVNVNSVIDCQTRQNVPFIIMDAFPPRGREEDLLILEPGYWYGSTIRFPLFARELGGLGPECIEAELSLMSFEGRCVGLHRVRVVRTFQQTSDGGVTGGHSSPADGGIGDAGPAQESLSSGPSSTVTLRLGHGTL